MSRRTYYMIVRIHRCTDRPGSADGEVVASSIRRSRLGIFQVNEWREIAAKVVAELGYEMGKQFGSHDLREWTYLAFIYGSFSPEGKGRCGSALMRMPTREVVA